MPFSHLEERVYDFRCVEDLVDGDSLQRPTVERHHPRGRAVSVSALRLAFTSVLRPEEMPGQASAFSTLDWPLRGSADY